MRSRWQRCGLTLAIIAAAAFSTAAGARTSDSAQPPATTSPAALPLESDGTLSAGTNAARAVKRHPGSAVQLSNETTLTRWAYAQREAVIRTQPAAGSGKVARLGYTSNEHVRQVYILLSGVTDASGHVWFKVRVPGRPNGRVGWTKAGGLYRPRIVHSQIVVDRGTLHATMYRNGQAVWDAPVGVGKPSTPTPGGHYVIEHRAGPIFGPAYGTHILFTNAFSTLENWPGGGMVGMHGTNEPGLVPGRPSHGCIRLHNEDINRLYKLVRVGTPLRIL
jgi:hypothetical protein